MKANFRYNAPKSKAHMVEVQNNWTVMKMLFILAYYNVVDNSLKTAHKQRRLIQDTVAEMDRLMFEEFKSDKDLLDLAISKFPKVAKELGFEYEVQNKSANARY